MLAADTGKIIKKKLQKNELTEIKTTVVKIV